jgi:hypothetical protein
LIRDGYKAGIIKIKELSERLREREGGWMIRLLSCPYYELVSA